MKRHDSKDVQMANKNIKRCSISLDVSEREIKTTMKYCFIPTRMATTKKGQRLTNVGKGGETGTLIQCWRRGKMVQPLC